MHKIQRKAQTRASQTVQLQYSFPWHACVHAVGELGSNWCPYYFSPLPFRLRILGPVRSCSKRALHSPNTVKQLRALGRNLCNVGEPASPPKKNGRGVPDAEAARFW
ncbi:hypothetical protein BaRGS_00034542 [Batillaria attramentaria]|uniref:Uncharacterized protein n=1 Tax=Batillaria attramentaria TaxID=370345 RepID=A0ABD0JH47_9CAEN